MTGGGRRTARSRTKSSADANNGDEDQEKPHFLKPVRNKARNHSSIRIFNVDLKFMLGLSVFACFVILFFIYNLIKPVEEAQRPRVVTPFPAPKVMDLPQVKCQHLSLCACAPDCVLLKQSLEIFGYGSFKASTRRACTGEHIGLRFISEFVQGACSYILVFPYA